MDQIQEILTALPGLRDLGEIYPAADRRLAAGDAAFVADLGIAVQRGSAGANQVRPFRRVFEHVLRLLAVTPGRENVEQALRLTAATGGRTHARYLASVLASSQAPSDLAVIFARGMAGAGGSQELRACLVHEMVLRGTPVEDIPPIASWATSPRWGRHPLRWLPLTRAAAEQAPDLPGYDVNGWTVSRPGGLPDKAETQPGPTAPPSQPGAAAAVTEITTPGAAAAMAGATANWAEASNGRIEARIFELDAPIGSLRDTLPRLDLECLDGLGRRDGLSAASCPASWAWRVLFSAASAGGAYSHGLYGAYGRLAAWRSLAAMSGEASTASFAEVERRVGECAWYCFGARTQWFHQVAWDIGLVAVAASGRRLAVLAASDTD